jgi:hypothetical protein
MYELIILIMNYPSERLILYDCFSAFRYKFSKVILSEREKCSL